MYAHIAMPLFESTVFTHKMQVIPPNYYGALHLTFSDNTSKNTSTDPDIARERAFLIDVSTIYRLQDKRISLLTNILQWYSMDRIYHYINLNMEVCTTKNNSFYRLPTSRGVLKPRPMSRCRRNTFFFVIPGLFLRFRLIPNCFWKALSFCIQLVWGSGRGYMPFRFSFNQQEFMFNCTIDNLLIKSSTGKVFYSVIVEHVDGFHISSMQ